MNTSMQSEQRTPFSSRVAGYAKRYQNVLFVPPVILVALSIFALALWGLKPGIDLAGGSLLQVAFQGEVSAAQIQEVVAPLAFGEVRVQRADDADFILRQRELTVEEKESLMTALATLGAVDEVQFNSIGPSIGSEIVRKAWWATGLVSLAMIFYIAYAFRQVADQTTASAHAVSSWKYGVIAVLALVHDVLLPTGLFAYLGHAHGVEVGVFFIVAILATVSISINNTIVVFDRIRENMRLNAERRQTESLVDVAWRSVIQTFARSINTTLTVVVMLVALFVVGPESTKDFSLVLLVGLVAGTYSSVLLLSPLLVLAEARAKKD